MTVVSDSFTRVSSIRHIYKPGVYKAELGIGRLMGAADYNSDIDRMKEESKLQAVEDAVKSAKEELLHLSTTTLTSRGYTKGTVPPSIVPGLSPSYTPAQVKFTEPKYTPISLTSKEKK